MPAAQQGRLNQLAMPSPIDGYGPGPDLKNWVSQIGRITPALSDTAWFVLQHTSEGTGNPAAVS